MRSGNRRRIVRWQAGLGHAERSENSVLVHLLDPLAGELLNAQSEQNVIRVRVVVALARSEVGLVLEGDREKFLRIQHLSRLGVVGLIEALVLIVAVEPA